MNFRLRRIGLFIRTSGAGRVQIQGRANHGVLWISRSYRVGRAKLFTEDYTIDQTLARALRRYRRLSVYFRVVFTPVGGTNPRFKNTKAKTIYIG